MKKTMWTVLIALGIIVTIGVICGNFSYSSSENMQQMTRSIITSVQNSQWLDAERSVAQLSGDWEKNSALLQLWVNHADADDVTLGISLLKVSLEEKNRLMSLLHAQDLIESISHIYHRDAFVLKNIL